MTEQYSSRKIDDRYKRDTRSRSPSRPTSHAHRTRSPLRHHSRKHPPGPKIQLPYKSREISKRDFQTFKPMFALYLDIQKGKVLDDLEEKEAKGRWKSFIGKWNRGELSEGWYDPETLHKAVQSTTAHDIEPPRNEPERSPLRNEQTLSGPIHRDIVEGSESDDSIGPALPGQSRSRGGRMGPSIPNMQDLELKREVDKEDGLARREDIRFDRKVDRKAQKERLDELAPRAEAGTRERQLEKKAEVNSTMKSFREKSPGGAEVPDTELMGGGDGIDSYKKEKEQFERKKNERELRKEEFLRARQAERDERLQEYRAKEEGTMSMLKALAKQRFG